MSTIQKDSPRFDLNGENSFALAIAVMRERMAGFCKEDKDDLYRLMPALLGDDPDERESAQKAVKEIFDQAQGTLARFEIPEVPAESLAKWLEYVSGKIRAARDSKSMTQERLAELSGIPQAHISRLEKGLHSPTAKTLERLANALSVDVSFFDPSR